MEQPTYACSLTDEELAVRRRQWQAVGEHATVREEPRADGLLLVYRGGDETMRALGQLIKAEQRCCPHLRFGIERAAEEVRVMVTFRT
jgi:hypothetical protein